MQVLYSKFYVPYLRRFMLATFLLFASLQTFLVKELYAFNGCGYDVYFESNMPILCNAIIQDNPTTVVINPKRKKWTNALNEPLPTVIRVKTDNGVLGTSAITGPTSFQLSVQPGSSINIDWESDGIMDETNVTITDIIHDYGLSGTFDITITGTLVGFRNMIPDPSVGRLTTDRAKLINIVQWGENTYQSFQNAFYGCENLQVIASDIPNVANVTNYSRAFANCSSLTDVPNMGSWDVSRATTFRDMFSNSPFFNENINDWDVGNAIDFIGMFNGAASYNSPMNQWRFTSDPTKSVRLASMFRGATSFNQRVDAWVMTRVVSVAIGDNSGMFMNAIAFNNGQSPGESTQPLEWERNGPQASTTRNIVTFNTMFRGAKSFNQPIDSWNMSGATSLAAMFRFADLFNQPLANWERPGSSLRNVQSFNNMFQGAINFNQSINNWNCSGGVRFDQMFRGASAFNDGEAAGVSNGLPFWRNVGASGSTSFWFMFGGSSFNQEVNHWNVAGCRQFGIMFSGTPFNQPLDNWVIDTTPGANIQMERMFEGAAMFNQDISSWDVREVTRFGGMFSGALSFDQSLGTWDLSSAVNFIVSGSSTSPLAAMLRNSGMSLCNYDATLIGWAVGGTVNNDLILGARGLHYCGSVAERDILINLNSWTIEGDSKLCPAFVCQDDIELDNDPGICGASFDFSAPSFDLGCIPDYPNSVSQVFGPSSGDIFPVGTTAVGFQVQFGSYIDLCTFNVTVRDVERPMAICSDVTLYLDANGTALLAVKDVDMSTDNCGINRRWLSQVEFDCGDLNDVQTVDLNVVDSEGNASTCSVNVRVEDMIQPVISYTGPQVLDSDQEDCTYIVVDSSLDPEVFDNCSLVSVTNNFSFSSTLAGSTLPMGVTNVEWVAEDASGNTGTFTVSYIVACSDTLDNTKAVAVNTFNPDPTAFFHVFSDDRGVLIPRLRGESIMSIPDPADGLLVFAIEVFNPIDELGFWFHSDGTWRMISPTNPMLWDEDINGNIVTIEGGNEKGFLVSQDGLLSINNDLSGDSTDRMLSLGSSFSGHNVNERTMRNGFSVIRLSLDGSLPIDGLTRFSGIENVLMISPGMHGDIAGVGTSLYFSTFSDATNSDVIEAFKNEIVHASGTTDSSIGIQARIESDGNSQSSNIMLMKGEYILGLPAEGTLSRAFGLHLGDINVGDNQNYSIYTNEGVVEIGDNLEMRDNSTIYTSRLNVLGIPVYRDKTEASLAGLPIGYIYRTPQGELKINQ